MHNYFLAESSSFFFFFFFLGGGVGGEGGGKGRVEIATFSWRRRYFL